MKKPSLLPTLIFITFFHLHFSAQDKIAYIDLQNDYEKGTTEDTYFKTFKLYSNINSEQIEDLKTNSLKYKYILDITISKNANDYLVKLLLDKKTEDISCYFRDYLLSIDVTKLNINNKLINTIDYCDYISRRANRKEFTGNNN